MKPKKTALLGAMFIGASTIVSQATITAYEGFNYTSGQNLETQDAPSPLGVWSSGQGGTISASSLSYGSLITSGGSTLSGGGGRPALGTGSSADTGGIQYVSFLGSNMGTGTTGYSFLEFRLGGTNTFGLGGSNNGNSGGNFTLETPAGFVNSTTLRDNATNFFVVKIDYGAAGAGTDVITWFLNPTVGGAEPVSTMTATGNFNFDDIAFAKFAGDPWTLDEVRMGTSFASVTPVPEPSTAALAGLAALGFAFTRRRRA